jgi:hypothetical protein
VHIHDATTVNHDMDFRILAVFPLQELQTYTVFVLRIDYWGQVKVELIPGTQAEPERNLFVVIHRGHMRMLRAPRGVSCDRLLREMAKARVPLTDTPALGWQAYLEQGEAQDGQGPADPQRTCRCCKLDKAAAKPPHSPYRTGKSARADANWEFHCCWPRGGKRVGHDSTRLDTHYLPGAAVVLKEICAGTQGVTKAWEAQGGKASEAVELYEDPETQTKPRAHHDVTAAVVQQRLILEARDVLGANVWVLEPVCTSFCSLQRYNGGTRTRLCPEGDPARLSASEATGNAIATFTAQLFLEVLNAGKLPIVENPAPDGRYPSMWDMPCWKQILSRKDVKVVAFPMCAFQGQLPGAKPHEFILKRTWLVMAADACLVAAALGRQCPGVSKDHQHTTLMGWRPGASKSRCTEASAYPPNFCRELAKAIAEGTSVGPKPSTRGPDDGPPEYDDWGRCAGEWGGSAVN